AVVLFRRRRPKSYRRRQRIAPAPGRTERCERLATLFQILPSLMRPGRSESAYEPPRESEICDSRCSDAIRAPRGDRVWWEAAMSGFDLCPMHHTSGRSLEWVATMHGAAIVPDHEVADTPGDIPRPPFVGCVRPDLIEQRLGLA